ncbi:MAG: VOC family protein [Candidatus Limnocylindria bacterium]
MRKMRSIGQIALASTDPTRVAEFYESAFGFSRRASDDSGVDLQLGGLELSFRRGERAARDGMQLGFRVETAAEVDAWAQELSRRGFALAGPPSGDRYEGTRSFRLADPDGRQVAVFFDYP